MLDRTIKVVKMDLNKLNDLANRIMKGGRSAGVGVGFLAAIGGAAYGLYQSMYTGITPTDTWFICNPNFVVFCLNTASLLHSVYRCTFMRHAITVYVRLHHWYR